MLILFPALLTNCGHTRCLSHVGTEGFGSEFSLVVSNKTLASTLKTYTDETFSGPRGQNRPDLLLLTRLGERYKLIEFKRPSHILDRRDISQAEQYRDDLISKLNPIDILVLGKAFDTHMLANMPTNVTIASYVQLISRARAELQWLLGELTSGSGRAATKL
jgi:hypothetical protein